MIKKLSEKLKKELEKEKGQIEKDMKGIAEENPRRKGMYITKFPNYGNSDDENADEVEEYGVDLAFEKNFEKRLKEINIALNKIKKNIYGICEKCKKAIPIKRLTANPEAKFCIGCVKK